MGLLKKKELKKNLMDSMALAEVILLEYLFALRFL